MVEKSKSNKKSNGKTSSSKTTSNNNNNNNNINRIIPAIENDVNLNSISTTTFNISDKSENDNSQDVLLTNKKSQKSLLLQPQEDNQLQQQKDYNTPQSIIKDKKKSPRLQIFQQRPLKILKDFKSGNDENKNEKTKISQSENNQNNSNTLKEKFNEIEITKKQKDNVNNSAEILKQFDDKKNIEKISKGICDKINSAMNLISSDSDEKLSKSSSMIKVVTPTNEEIKNTIPEVLRKQGTASLCSSNIENTCPCNTMEDIQQVSRKVSYCDRRNWISVERMNELRKRAQDAIKHHKTFTIRGCFFSIRNSLVARGWVEKLDVHRRYNMSGCYQVNYEDLTNGLPKRRPGETRRQYLIKCERNIMSRFLEHMPIDFLWTARKEKCDWIDQSKNPSMVINKFHSVPFTSKEGLCSQLREFHWFYEEGISELYFPRCYNVWNPEELSEFIDNFRLTGCIGFLKFIVEKFYLDDGYNQVFSDNGKIPFTSLEFAFKRCTEFIDNCNHNDIDNDEPLQRIWDHDWDAFLTNHYILTHEGAKIQLESNRIIDPTIRAADRILRTIKTYWPQYNLDGYLNVWIVKPANKCRGRGIHMMNNIRKILSMVNPSIVTKSRYVVQKYIERPLIIHGTKFDIRQWFLVTNVQPLIIWMYKESYLRFSSQEYDLKNYHESVHLTNHAVQKKYRNGSRDKRLPNENMWDCYTFQAYLRQIGKIQMWDERIFPGMKHAITGAMLASQDNMDRRANTFELFGADFMITEDFYPWLIEINSSPDLGATTSVTARMCPQCLEDIIKVIIDRKNDPKSDTGNFEMVYRQVIPPAPAYMGLNLFLKGKQLTAKNLTTFRREKSLPQLRPLAHMSVINAYHSTLSLADKDTMTENNQKPTIIEFCDDSILLPFEDDNRLNMKPYYVPTIHTFTQTS